MIAFKIEGEIPETNLRELDAEVCSMNYRGAFPRELSDRWLFSLARDLRRIEPAINGASKKTPKMHGPVLVAQYMIESHIIARGCRLTGPLTADITMTALRIYQYLIEREVVSRVTREDTAQNETDHFVFFLDLEMAKMLEQGKIERRQ